MCWIEILRNVKYQVADKDIEDWEKITSHQFKDAYLAVMKDFQDPDFEERPGSNWNKVLNSIVTSVNS